MSTVILTRGELTALMRVSIRHPQAETFSVEWLPHSDRIIVAVGEHLYELGDDCTATPITADDIAGVGSERPPSTALAVDPGDGGNHG